MLINTNHLTMLNSPRQTIRGRVELYKGSSLERICTCSDILSELQVERTGEGKFFGFGICQKLKTSLIDIDRELNITKEHTAEVAFGVNSEYIYPFPRFYVQDVERDEVSNMVTVTAYDILFKAEEYKVSDLSVEVPYTLRSLAAACATVLNVPLKFINVDETAFLTSFPTGTANLSESDSVRYILNAIAEATQTIYYISNQWELTFRRLDKNAALAITVDKAKYMELHSGENRTLTNITHTTELGDNTSTVGDGTGVTQFVRENPFWELREDIDDLLNQALINIAGLSINQFEAYWSGNYLLEIGDRFGFIGENNETISTFLLDDTITFAGTLEEQSRWQYDENEGETETNPVTLGDALNQTYARVDKANGKIEMLVQKTNGQENRLSKLEQDAESFTITVEEYQTKTDDTLGNVQEDIKTTREGMEEKITAQGATFTAFKEQIDKNGVTKVSTTSGTFDEHGLTMTKDGSATSTNLNSNGLIIYQGAISEDENGNITNEKLLEVSDQGVKATNLHATTYLIIGGRSQFENMEDNRIGCFWMGGIN